MPRVGQRTRTEEVGGAEGSSAPARRSSSQHGSGTNGNSSIESMGGSGAPDQTTKSFAQKFFEKASKLWCCGPLFKTIAGWFNIVIDDNNGNIPNQPNRQKQTEAKKIIEKVFAKENPSAKKIGEAQKAFKTLSVSAKLAVLKDLLGNDNCTAKAALTFIKLLGPALAKLKEHILEVRGDDSDRPADVIMNKNCKGKIVRKAVAACLADVQNKADESKAKLIRKTFDGKGQYPNPQARKAALEAFRGLESPLTQLMIFADLVDSGHILDSDLAEFSAVLTQGEQTGKAKAADDSDDEEVLAFEEVSKAKGKKAKGKEEEDDEEEEETVKGIHPSNLQGRLLALVKGERQADEEEEISTYKECVAAIKQYKKAHNGQLPKDETGKTIEMPPKPKAFDNLKDYFNVRASDNHLRQTLQDQTKALLKQIQEEQGTSGDTEE